MILDAVSEAEALGFTAPELGDLMRAECPERLDVLEDVAGNGGSAPLSSGPPAIMVTTTTTLPPTTTTTSTTTTSTTTTTTLPRYT